MEKVRIVALEEDKTNVVAALHRLGIIDLRKSKLEIADDKPASYSTDISDSLVKVNGALQILPVKEVKNEKHIDVEELLKEAKSLKVLDTIYSLVSHTSRAETKIAEAFESFRIKGNGVAIDLGAAPGGWSKFLAKSGYKVIAIDAADLNYKSLEEAGLKVKVTNSAKELDHFNILHIRSRSGNTEIKGIKLDLLADDMNMDCKSSAEEALKYAPLLKKNGILIMTIKCMNRNAPKFIAQARNILGKRFSIKEVKVLPINRQEVTLYATYKG